MWEVEPKLFNSLTVHLIFMNAVLECFLAMSANHLWIANYATLKLSFEIGEVYIIYFLGWTTKGGGGGSNVA